MGATCFFTINANRQGVRSALGFIHRKLNIRTRDRGPVFQCVIVIAEPQTNGLVIASILSNFQVRTSQVNGAANDFLFRVTASICDPEIFHTGFEFSVQPFDVRRIWKIFNIGGDNCGTTNRPGRDHSVIAEHLTAGGSTLFFPEQLPVFVQAVEEPVV